MPALNLCLFNCVIVKTIACFLVFLICVAGCDKDDDYPVNGQSDDHIYSLDLISEKDTLVHGESTKITAQYEGEGVRFSWEATQGDILGYGSEITYVALLCNCGKSRIDCTAAAGSNKISKSIIIIIVDE